MSANPLDTSAPSRRVAPRLVVTIRGTAKQMGVTELTVRRHIKAGKLRAVQIGGSWRIPVPESERIRELPLECTLHQVANSLDVSDLTVRRWIRTKKFPATKRDGVWIVQRNDLERLLMIGAPAEEVEREDEWSDGREPERPVRLRQDVAVGSGLHET